MIRIILGFHRFRCPVAHGLVQPFRVPATRPTGTSPAPDPSDHGRACAARRARSCTRRRRIRPWRCRRSRRPCRSTAACHIPSPWWRTPCRCTARHDRRGGRDRRPRHATRPRRSPGPRRMAGPTVSPATAIMACSTPARCTPPG